MNVSLCLPGSSLEVMINAHQHENQTFNSFSFGTQWKNLLLIRCHRGGQKLCTSRLVLPVADNIFKGMYFDSVLLATFRPNIKQSRGKEHSLENAVFYRKDNPIGTQFLPSPHVALYTVKRIHTDQLSNWDITSQRNYLPGKCALMAFIRNCQVSLDSFLTLIKDAWGQFWSQGSILRYFKTICRGQEWPQDPYWGQNLRQIPLCYF